MNTTETAKILKLFADLNSIKGSKEANTIIGKINILTEYRGNILVTGIREAKDINSDEEFAANEQIGIYYSIKKENTDGTYSWDGRYFETIFDNEDVIEFNTLSAKLKELGGEVSDRLKVPFELANITVEIDESPIGYWIPKRGSRTEKNPLGIQQKNKRGRIIQKEIFPVFKGREGSDIQTRRRRKIEQIEPYLLKAGASDPGGEEEGPQD